MLQELTDTGKLHLSDKFFLIILILIFNLASSSFFWQVSAFSAARWGVILFLSLLSIGYALRFNHGRIKLLPKSFQWLIYPLLIQCLWDLESIDITASRSLSFFLYCIAIYFFLSRKAESSEYIKNVYFLFAAFMGLFTFFSNLATVNAYSINGDFIGFYPNRNMTVSVLLSALVLFGNYLLSHQFLLRKYAFYGFISLITYMIFITHSRMAFFCYFLILIYFLLFVHTKKNLLRNIFLCITLPIFVALLPIIGETFDITAINRVFVQNSIDDSTGIGRDVWDIGFALISERPVFGWGANSVYYHTFVNAVGTWGWGVHNSYLVMLIEGGIVGTCFYAIFFAHLFGECWKRYKQVSRSMSKQDIIFIKMCFLSCLVLFLNGFSESFLFSAGNIMALPFWFSLLTMYAYLNKKWLEMNH